MLKHCFSLSEVLGMFLNIFKLIEIDFTHLKYYPILCFFYDLLYETYAEGHMCEEENLKLFLQVIIELFIGEKMQAFTHFLSRSFPPTYFAAVEQKVS